MTAHYLYRCYGHDGRLIYVGCTRNLAGRLYNHRLNSFWAYDVARVRAVVYPTKQEAREYEAAAIREERPRFNIAHRWSSHMTWTADEFDDYLRAIEAVPQTACTRRRVERVRAIRQSVVSRRAA